MKYEAITVDIAERYRKDIAQFYFYNVRSNSFHEHYTYDEAYEKIGGMINHLKDNTAIVYGVFEDETFCGFIWAYVHQFREETRIYVSEIRVKEEYRKRGIGTELLRLVEDKAKEMNISAVYLHAEAENNGARKLYEACGYTEERIQMRKQIK